ncbi:MAG: cupin domain-containing protein [Pseudomonadales bacterium]
MPAIDRIDPAEFALDIHRDLSIRPRKRNPGPPERIDGMTVGIVTMTEDAPHDGEVHPDGDEILYVISGKVRITCDSDPNGELVLGPGQACIVPRGEWHKVSILEETQLLHVTPGPNGDHRPLR